MVVKPIAPNTFAALADRQTADLPAINDLLAAALAGRAPGGQLVAYAGTGRALIATDNGNVIRCTSATAVTMTVPSALAAGFSCVIVQGGAGLVTAVPGGGVTLTPAPAYVTNGVDSDLLISPAGTDTYTVYSPFVPGVGGSTTLAALTDIHSYDLAAQNDSIAAALLLAGGVVLSIAGTRGTGNTLSATVASGWQGTFQWQRRSGGGSWTDISGQVASSTVELIGDVANDIRCLFLPTSFFSNILASSGGGGAPFVPFTELWVSAGNGNPPPSPWAIIAGAPKEFVLGGLGWYDDRSSNSLVVRNAGGADGVIEFPLSDNGGGGGVVAGVQYPFFVFRGNSAGAVYSYVTINGGDNKLHYAEWNGSDNNTAVGTRLFPTDSTRTGLRITLTGASVVIAYDIGAGYVDDITVTAVQGLAFTYVGLGYSNGGTGAGHGPMHVT